MERALGWVTFTFVSYLSPGIRPSICGTESAPWGTLNLSRRALNLSLSLTCPRAQTQCRRC